MTDPKELIRKIMEYHGFSSGKELKESELFARAMGKAGSAAGALRELSRVKHEHVTVNGWFLRTRPFTRWNNDKNTMEEVGRGPQVLLADGTVTSFNNGQELDLDPLSTVQIGPLTKLDNLETGETHITTPNSEIKVQVVDHDETLPSVTMTEFLHPTEGRCNQISTGRRGRGIIYGDTGRYPIHATLTIGGRNDIDWFRPGASDFNPEGTLRVRAFDEDGNSVQIKLPIEKVQRIYNLTNDDPQGAYQETLEGKRIFAVGQASVLYPRSRDNVDNPAYFDRFLQQLDDAGYLTTYRQWRNDDGTQQGLKALSLEGHRDEDGEPIKALYSEDLNIRVFDAKEERPGEWMLYVHAEDINKDPWMNCKETRFERDDGSLFIRNEGAFVAFLDQLGITDENDPFAQAAASLGLDNESVEAGAESEGLGTTPRADL